MSSRGSCTWKCIVAGFGLRSASPLLRKQTVSHICCLSQGLFAHLRHRLGGPGKRRRRDHADGSGPVGSGLQLVVRDLDHAVGHLGTEHRGDRGFTGIRFFSRLGFDFSAESKESSMGRKRRDCLSSPVLRCSLCGTGTAHCGRGRRPARRR